MSAANKLTACWLKKKPPCVVGRRRCFLRSVKKASCARSADPPEEAVLSVLLENRANGLLAAAWRS